MGFLNIFKKRVEPAAPAPAQPAAEPSRPAKTVPTGATLITGVVLRRLVTEKASAGAARAQYFFAVARGANKIMIRHALRQRYGVAPLKVRILNVRGRRLRSGRRRGATKPWKKAIATFPAGSKIEGEKPAS